MRTLLLAGLLALSWGGQAQAEQRLQRAGDREGARHRVGQADGRAAVACAVFCEARDGFRVRSARQLACQHGGVAQAQVQALAGHRVQRLRGIADGDRARRGARFGVQAQWERAA